MSAAQPTPYELELQERINELEAMLQRKQIRLKAGEHKLEVARAVYRNRIVRLVNELRKAKIVIEGAPNAG